MSSQYSQNPQNEDPVGSGRNDSGLGRWQPDAPPGSQNPHNPQNREQHRHSGNSENSETHPVRLVYIAHPFGSDPAGNAERVRRLCATLKHDCVPLAPQLMLPAYIDEAPERDVALRHCLRLLAACDEVRVYGEPTAGMRLEIAEARRLGIPVVFANDQNGDDPRAGTTRAVGEGRAC